MSYLQICLSAVTLKHDTLKHPPEFRWQIGKRKAFGECQSSRLRKGALLKDSRFVVSFGFCLFFNCKTDLRRVKGIWKIRNRLKVITPTTALPVLQEV